MGPPILRDGRYAMIAFLGSAPTGALLRMRRINGQQPVKPLPQSGRVSFKLRHDPKSKPLGNHVQTGSGKVRPLGCPIDDSLRACPEGAFARACAGAMDARALAA